MAGRANEIVNVEARLDDSRWWKPATVPKLLRAVSSASLLFIPSSLPLEPAWKWGNRSRRLDAMIYQKNEELIGRVFASLWQTRLRYVSTNRSSCFRLNSHGSRFHSYLFPSSSISALSWLALKFARRYRILFGDLSSCPPTLICDASQREAREDVRCVWHFWCQKKTTCPRPGLRRQFDGRKITRLGTEEPPALSLSLALSLPLRVICLPAWKTLTSYFACFTSAVSSDIVGTRIHAARTALVRSLRHGTLPERTVNQLVRTSSCRCSITRSSSSDQVSRKVRNQRFERFSGIHAASPRCDPRTNPLLRAFRFRDIVNLPSEEAGNRNVCSIRSRSRTSRELAREEERKFFLNRDLFDRWTCSCCSVTCTRNRKVSILTLHFLCLSLSLSSFLFHLSRAIRAFPQAELRFRRLPRLAPSFPLTICFFFYSIYIIILQSRFRTWGTSKRR